MAEQLEQQPTPVEHVIDQPESVSEDQITETTAEESAETVTETTEQQEEKRQSKFQRRLERHKTRAITAETEARLLREQLAELKARSIPQQESQEPKREQFENYEDYLEARVDYKADQKVSAALKTQAEAQAKQQQRQAPAADPVATAWTEREKAFKTQVPTYEADVDEFVEGELQSFSMDARKAIVEYGPAVLHHLATHSDVADRISGLSTVRQIAELGKLEASLATKQPKRTSTAPPPINPVSQGRSASAHLTGNESQAEYEAKRKAGGAPWAR